MPRLRKVSTAEDGTPATPETASEQDEARGALPFQVRIRAGSVCFRVHWNVRVLRTSRSTQPACVQAMGWVVKTVHVSFPTTLSCEVIRTWRSHIPHVAVDPMVTTTSRFPLPSPSL